jgi:type I restriction enzyme S subunit
MMYVSESKEHITETAIKESSTRLIEKGSLLLGMYDTAALKSTISTIDITCNQAIAYSKLDDKLVNTVYAYFIIQIGKEDYKKFQRGVRQKNLNLSMIKNLEILLPHLKLQNQFAERVTLIEEQKAITQKSLAKSEDLFNSLLQKAFKGELI